MDLAPRKTRACYRSGVIRDLSHKTTDHPASKQRASASAPYEQDVAPGDNSNRASTAAPKEPESTTVTFQDDSDDDDTHVGKKITSSASGGTTATDKINVDSHTKGAISEPVSKHG